MLLRFCSVCLFVMMSIVVTPNLVIAQGAGLITDDNEFAPIEKKLAKEISKFKTKPRVAVFSIGNFKGMLDEASIARSQAMTKLLISKLQKNLANNAFVVGPSGIRKELEVLKNLSHDPSQIDFDDPKTASEWLDQALPGVFDFALFSRMNENVNNSQLKVLVVSKLGQKVLEGELNRPIGIDDEEVLAPHDRSQRFIAVNLYAVETAAPAGQGEESPTPPKRTLIPLKYRKMARPVGDERMYRNELSEPIIASIPAELDDAMSEGRLSLEIELEHTGKPIRKELVDKEIGPDGLETYFIYTLNSNTNRLLACAVSIDGRTTIGEAVNDPKDTSKQIQHFPDGEPQYRMRKWLVPQRGFQIKYNLSPDNVYTPVLNPDQSPVIERAQAPVKVVVKGFQTSDDSADAFVLNKPSLGSPASAGITTAPGLIRVSVYAQKMKTDGRRTEVMAPAGDDDGDPVRIATGAKVESNVVKVNVQTYRPPLEEFIILLRSEKQLASTKANLAEYVQAVTGP